MRGLKRSLLLAAGWINVGLAVIGTILPIMPTVPFLILAFWAFANSSPKLSRRILAHPRFGPVLLDWLRYRAVPRWVKYFSIAAMATSLAGSYYLGAPVWLWGGQAALYVAIGLYILTRPDPPRKPRL